ncbi:MAG: hypothetical protein PHY47_15970 [Lachnospiraceae bacterium]|nr:hypothetical protein [Lachnospiraceae bacterium]
MSDSGKIHELKVVIRAALSGYKKDMGSVKSETKKARDAIEGETSKINQAMGKVSSAKAQKELENLTNSLNRQKEKIVQQENVINSLRNQYDSLISGMTQDKGVSGIEKQLKSAEKEFEVAKQKMASLLDEYEIYEAAAQNGGGSSHLKEISDQIDELDPKYESLGRNVEKLKAQLEQVKMNPESSSTAQDMAAKIDIETKKLERLKNEAGTTKEKLDAVMNSKSPPGTRTKLSQILSKIKELTRNAKTSSAETSKGFSNMEKSVERFKKRITALIASAFIFNVLSSGLRNFNSYMLSCLKTNTEFSSSLNIIKTNLQVSFAAIYTAVLPAINAMMTALAALSQALATMLSAIFGKTYSQSLQTAQGLKTATDAMKGYGSAKEAAQNFSFDETNNITKNDSSSGGSSSGEDLMDPSAELGDTPGIIDKIKESLKTLFDPLRESWDTNGAGVIDSAKYALSSIQTLCSDIGKSFAEVWTNGTGVKVCNDILNILKNVFITVGNIATGLDKAWNFDDTGTKIVQSLFDILLNVLDAIDEMSQATADWSASLDFTPIMTAFSGLLDAIEPLTGTVCDGLVWMYENVLLPFASWSIEDAIPAFFDLLAAAIGAINDILVTFQPLGLWLWDSFLQPIASWTGGVIVSVLETLADVLTAIGDWVSEHQTIMETLAVIIGSIAAAIELVNAGMAIYNVAAAIFTAVTSAGGVASAAAAVAAGALGAAIAFLTSPITIAIAIIAALIAIGVLLYKNWDTVKLKAQAVWTAIKTTISTVVTTIKTAISTMLTNVSNTWNTVWTGCKTVVTNIFNGIWNTIKGVINSILGGIESMANGVVNGINTVINALNQLHFDIPDWVPGFGGKSFGFNIGTLSPVTLPRLAKGGIIDGATPLIAGEAGREAIVPLENNTGWLDLIAAKISEQINSKFTGTSSGSVYGDEINISIPITLEMDGETILKKLIKARKRLGYKIVVEGV